MTETGTDPVPSLAQITRHAVACPHERAELALRVAVEANGLAAKQGADEWAASVDEALKTGNDVFRATSSLRTVCSRPFRNQDYLAAKAQSLSKRYGVC